MSNKLTWCVTANRHLTEVVAEESKNVHREKIGLASDSACHTCVMDSLDQNISSKCAVSTHLLMTYQALLSFNMTFRGYLHLSDKLGRGSDRTMLLNPHFQAQTLRAPTGRKGVGCVQDLARCASIPVGTRAPWLTCTEAVDRAQVDTMGRR